MINTTLCYIENDGKYLMLYRNKKHNDINKGKYIGVGGKFEAGESPEECLIREVMEETGLELLSHKFRGIVTFCSPLSDTEYMFLYTSDSFKGTLKECNEGNLEWVQKENLLSLSLWEGDKIFLEELLKNSPFFSLKLVYDKDDKLIDSTLKFN